MKIIISDCDHVNLNEETAVFEAAGLDFELKQCRTEDELISECKGGEIFINQYAPFTRRVLEALRPEIRQIVRYGVGVNNIDLEAATELGVQVCNVPDYGMNEVADQALALTLDLARKVSFMNADVRKGRWNYEDSIPLFRLSEQTLGVAGLGRNGRNFAGKARALFGRVVGYDPYYKPNAADGTDYIEPVDLDTLLRTADFVVLHMPLTDETRNIINADAFAKMKSTAYLVNTSRGGLVDEAALDKALSEGAIAGAALDVTEKEPIDFDSPLLRHDNFICTPHMAWYSEQAASELKRKVAEEAVRFARGEKLRSPVNRV